MNPLTFLSSFNTLIDHLKNNPRHVFVAVALLLFGYALFSIGGQVSALADPTPAGEAIGFQKAIAANQEINSDLENLRKNTGASRVLIRQFSNGKRNLAGFPFNFITTTHYVVKAGVSFPSINPFPLTSMNPSLERMWVDYRNPKCIVDSVKDMGDDEPIYRDYLRQHGVEKLVACPIVSLQSYPVGLIGIGFIDANDQTLSDEEMVARTQVVAVRVAGYLGSISNAEIKPWWKVW